MGRTGSDETVDHAFQAVRAAPDYCLSIVREGRAPFTIVLPAGALSVGREAQADLCLKSRSLSRLHFAVAVAHDGVTVRDLGSRNGTFVDGAPIADAPAPLTVGAEVVAGDVHSTLLRRANLPHGARPFVSLAGLESQLPTSLATHVAALELEPAVDASPAALQVLSQLPPDATLAIVSDDTLLVAASSTTLEWLRGALGPRARRFVVRPIDRVSGATALLRELEAPGAVPPEQDDLPPAFRYPSLRPLHDTLRKIAPRGISVLVHGETGTGKEVVARELHRLSRRSGPLVAVNTAALPETLIESELFGHERGAFSGAQAAKAGLIESSDRGTLFLDEIGELSLPLQAKLLRVLEDQSVRRVGATSERKIDLRVVAATHQDLEALAREKKFRQDLLYRLNGAVVTLPPLRERRGEIGPLAQRLAADLSGERSAAPPSIDPAAIAALEAYAWPGNVRELKHVLERALAFADDGVVRLEHLPATVAGSAGPSVHAGAAAAAAASAPAAGDVRSTVRDFERDRILDALRQTGGNRTRAAELLGLPRRTLVYKLSKLKLDEE
ncbi:MAG: sigma 54-interacting transcriptional regulator [Polyangiaceae bacterium]|jgi:two-component system response regulator AtoC|nr:sigma 54-interacting transcriptional regulator [Polyangiaceae bacterium]MBK8937370.1 sigma 54-interacting transcriptional regulator [Polyangiaceae bacterium]